MYDIDLLEFVSDAAAATAARATFLPSRYSIYLFYNFFSLSYLCIHFIL